MPKVICIGLDGATFDLIKPFIAQGQLPTFKKLMDSGAFSELRSTVPPVTASAWSSFMTGKNPGAHGLFDFMQRRDKSYDLAPVSALDRDGKAVWDLMGEAGKKVIVMNVPVTWPPQPVNGQLVTGMLTPRNAENYTYPKELADELKSAIGEYIVYSDEVYIERARRDFSASVETFCRSAHARRRILDAEISLGFFHARLPGNRHRVARLVVVV